MKKIVSFDQIKETKLSGLDAAIECAFCGANSIIKEGLVGFPFGTIEVDGKGWDWVLKNDHYVFIEA